MTTKWESKPFKGLSFPEAGGHLQTQHGRNVSTEPRAVCESYLNGFLGNRLYTFTANQYWTHIFQHFMPPRNVGTNSDPYGSIL